MWDQVDLLVCGAGPAGCVVAERAARLLGWNVLVVDRRRHIAGNCRDSQHSSGVLVHDFGPHYFRTNDPALVEYLSKFTAWIPGNYIVKSRVGGKLLPFPINLDTLEQFFDRPLDADSAAELLRSKRLAIDDPANSEELVLGRVGRELYESFYRHYTQKQWGVAPTELDAGVCGRIPVRFDRDPRFVEHRYQIMPAAGFTALFAKMLSHRRIRVELDCDFHSIRSQVQPRFATVFTGPIDAYFGHCFGKLPYRSLQFELVEKPTRFVQPCVQINYPDAETPFTRSVEYKHVTGQEHPHTVVGFETPRSAGEPFYPVPTAASRTLYDQYRELAEVETRRERVYFCGRLAQYRYFNTDEVIQEALRCFEQIRQRCRKRKPSVSSRR